MQSEEHSKPLGGSKKESNSVDTQETNDLGKELSEPEAMQVWQYFASVGGNDKDRMITASTWLLAFSGAIIGYSVTEGLSSSNCISVLVLAILGVFVSLLAVCVTLMYGGYANRNWAIADILAEQRGWYDLVPLRKSHVAVELEKKKNTRKPVLPLNWAERLSQTKDPLRELAPIFCWFFWFAVFSAVAHVALIIITLSRL